MRILVSGGGTGGHIYPAVSLVKHIRKNNPNVEFMYVGTDTGLESSIVPKENISFAAIEIQGFKRSLSLDNLKTVYLFLKSVRQSKKIIKDFKPDVVIGTGGYVCGSVVYAAHRLGVPTIIHEQNSVAGMTNKFLARYVDKIAICFTDVAKDFPADKTVLIGNPRAQEVAGIAPSDVLENYDLKSDKPTVLIFGGSRGALTINEAMLESLSNFKEKPYQVLYASGRIYYPDIEKVWDNAQSNNVKVVPYIDDMEHVLANIDLVVGRAGATSMAEITSLGLPSILIPSPNVTNDHQTKNAQSLVDKGAAIMLADKDTSEVKLIEEIDKVMLNDSLRIEMSQASASEGIQDATDRFYELVQSLVKED
ncbi:undecaprenyldiphospho-muramoylpentapeptide beta-N-acetylglucosaminyltransferase [Vagococcus vulneris]|uniref:UDP-N-acetylglucosamine--N-acetylmuramyl-(pentapeptide) pyrophosphoryl-undecaprenol N-acetylglucosamine transferase n=1 Tax=Vagococcus vulneris TaxID=1977869 RepID=A0A429ZWC2_9ENTE|nr:undecaprenyldiphospho-muramoylpentapeptide beta-N-acetylglucosaminyltransferase [Vagococcus vulneris]RST98038.1 undecaprenyldiphospho-muramoylpentapeptide beta-N-acetylglucosaminyltransferase [Vagococcus vulneris]